MVMDSGNKFQAAISGLQVSIMTKIATEKLDIGILKDWKENRTVLALSSYRATRESYLAHPDPTPLLGQASNRMYSFVRQDLGIPFLLTQRLLEMETQSSASEDSVIADDIRISAKESAPDIDRNMRDICPNSVFNAHTSNDENFQQVANEDPNIADNKAPLVKSQPLRSNISCS